MYLPKWVACQHIGRQPTLCLLTEKINPKRGWIKLKNEYEIRGEVTAIFIDSKKFGLMETIISTDKLNMLMEIPVKWGLHKSGTKLYVQASKRISGGHKTFTLHRVITNASGKEMVIDHINHNTLDNTDSNLRIVDTTLNGQNRSGPNSNNKTTGIRGVYWSSRDKRFIARMTAHGKDFYLGCFADIEEAERVVTEARNKHMAVYQGV